VYRHARLATSLDPGLNFDLISKTGLSVSRLFGDKEWEVYQSPLRYYQQLSSITDSVVFRRLWLVCGSLSGWATLVEAVDHLNPMLLADTLSSPVALVGGSVTLLLVFRTNTAYGRFAKARDSWADVSCHCRNLSRKIRTWFPEDTDELELRSRAGRVLAALPWALKSRSQGISGTKFERVRLTSILGEEDAVYFLGREDENRCMRKNNVPMQLLRELTLMVNELNKFGVPPIYHLLMDNDVTALQKQLAMQDRLVTTPTPITYTRHTSRCIMIWLLILPLGLVKVMGWELVAFVALLSYVLLGIDDIGVQIEQPFTILPLNDICEEIEDEIVFELQPAEAVDSSRWMR